MRKLSIPLFVLTIAILGFTIPQVNAIPAFKNEFEALYGDRLDEDLLAEARCNSCHVPGESKRVHNEYGAALEEFLKKDDFPRERVEAEPEAVAAEIRAALLQVESMDAPGGGTYGERITNGQLPIDLPPEEEDAEE